MLEIQNHWAMQLWSVCHKSQTKPSSYAIWFVYVTKRQSKPSGYVTLIYVTMRQIQNHRTVQLYLAPSDLGQCAGWRHLVWVVNNTHLDTSCGGTQGAQIRQRTSANSITGRWVQISQRNSFSRLSSGITHFNASDWLPIRAMNRR